MITLTSCISVDYDLPFLPHFINHYSKLEIDTYLLIFHSKNEFNFSEIHKTLKPISHKTISTSWIGDFDAATKIDKLNELQSSGYILTTDIDEFQIYDKPLSDYILEKEIIWGKLRDRETPDSNLATITNENLNLQFPVVSSKSNWGRGLFKPCLYPAKYKLLSPHHLTRSEPNEDDVIKIDHFRWVKGRLEKSIERLKNYNKLNDKGVTWYKYYNRFPTIDLQNVIDEYGVNIKTKI